MCSVPPLEEFRSLLPFSAVTSGLIDILGNIRNQTRRVKNNCDHDGDTDENHELGHFSTEQECDSNNTHDQHKDRPDEIPNSIDKRFTASGYDEIVVERYDT